VRYAVEAAPGTQGVRVPALLLQPLVENAALHGVADDRDTLSIWVGARLAGTPPLLVLEVGNRSTGQLPAAGAGSGAGVGLANTRARLAACYGGRATLAYGPTDEHSYLVSVTLPASGGVR
jgi:LytS/YehU family sensor histidine kinase